MTDSEIYRLFHKHFKATDNAFTLFSALAEDWENEELRQQAYDSKKARTTAMAALMAALANKGIYTYSQGHSHFFNRRFYI